MNWKSRSSQLKIDIPAIFLAMKDPETPPGAKLLAGLTVAYALSPVDLIPDFIPVLGYLDDLLLLPVLAAGAIALIPKPVMADCRARAAGMWADGKPKKWYFALPILAVWFLLLIFIGKAVLF